MFSILFSKFDIDTLKYLLFIQNITDNFVDLDYFFVAWSLSIEEFFYFIFPIFLVLFNKKKFIHIVILFILIIYVIKIVYLFSNADSQFYRVGTFLRLDSIAFGVLTRIYLEKIRNNFINIISIILVIVSMSYFIKDFKNLSTIELFLFILLMQALSINTIIIFINFNKFIVGKYLSSFFSLLAKQTYSIYLFHFIFVYLIKENEFLLNIDFIFIFYLIILFLFSSLFYYIFEEKIIKNRPIYND